MRFLLISDIHCISSDLKNANEYNGTTGSAFIIEERASGKNLILNLSSVLQDYRNGIDALICLGDIAHQSKKLAITAAWGDLNRLAVELGIPKVLAVTGNHDIDSRATTVTETTDRLDFLRSLYPPYPINDESQVNSYFGSGVAYTDLQHVRIVLVDTTRLHGLGGNPEASRLLYERGCITNTMLQSIERYVQEAECQHVIIAMHHHPRRLDEIQDQDYDELQSGPELLRMLGDSGKTCYILHGHKHFVKAWHEPIGAIHPFVFSCNTFASYAYVQQPRHFINQFHILEIDSNTAEYSSGVIKSWSREAEKWCPSVKPEMQHIFTFGRPVNLKELARLVNQLSFESSIDRDALLTLVGDIKLVDYSKRDAFESELGRYDLLASWHNSILQRISRL